MGVRYSDLVRQQGSQALSVQAANTTPKSQLAASVGTPSAKPKISSKAAQQRIQSVPASLNRVRAALLQATPDGLEQATKEFAMGKRTTDEHRKQDDIKRRCIIAKNVDHEIVLRPFKCKAFDNVGDAVSKLMAYHVYASSSPVIDRDSEGDVEFKLLFSEVTARSDQYCAKYRDLSFKEDARSERTCDSIMLMKKWIIHESDLLKAEKDVMYQKWNVMANEEIQKNHIAAQLQQNMSNTTSQGFSESGLSMEQIASLVDVQEDDGV